MTEQRLPGGFVNAAVLVDGTVRRTPTPRSGYVARLLGHFEARGWAGAPRVLGRDDAGRDVFSFLPGRVPWEYDARVAADASLESLAGLVREAHDLTAGHPLAEGGEVVCHNDLSPRNTVYRDEGGALRPVALLDWDLAAPGRRVHDVAHLCWQFLRLGPGCDAPAAARRVRVVADAYGLAPEDRADLMGTVLWWQERCRRGIEQAAADGDPAMVRLRDAGVPAEVRAAHAWTAAHRPTLESRL